MSPRKLTTTKQDQVIRVKMDTRLIKMMREECAMENIEPPQFLRRLVSHQMGTTVVGRPPQSKRRRLLSGTAKTSTESIVIYVSREMYDFVTQLATRCGITKTSLLALLLCDYFDILPLKLGEMQPTPER